MELTYVSLALHNISKVYLSSAIADPSQMQISDEQQAASGSKNEKETSDAGTF